MKIKMKETGKERFGELDIEELLEFELQNEVSLPEDYKQFLIEYNGGKPALAVVPAIDTDVQWLYGIHNGPEWASLLATIDIYMHRIPSWFFPIGNDSLGNLFIMSLYEENKGIIAFWDHERELRSGDAEQYFDNVKAIANSFSDFINMLV